MQALNGFSSPPGGEPGERYREQRPADAVADRVHLLCTRNVPDGFDGGQRPLRHVVLELGVLHRGVRVLPGGHKDGVALVDEVLDHAVFRPEVEDVVLVDPGREEDYRGLVDLLRRRLVLDQLYELVFVDDFTRRDREVLARLEGIRVGHVHPALFEVREQVPGALGEARPAGLEGPLDGRRVGQEVVDRGHRVHELLQVELELALLVRVLAVGRLGLVEEVLRGEQVRFLERLVEGVLGPVGCCEAIVRTALLCVFSTLDAPEAVGGVLPTLEGRTPELRVEVRGPLQGLCGIGHFALPEGLEGLAYLDPVYGQHVLDGVRVPELLHNREQGVVAHRPTRHALGLVPGRYAG